MNQNQLEAQRAQLAAESAEVDRLLNASVSTKNYSSLSDLEGRVEKLAEQRADLDRAEASLKASAAHPLAGAFAADLGSGAGNTIPADNNQRLSFDKVMAKGIADQILSTKALAGSGAAVVGQEFRADPIAMGKPPATLLDILPTVVHSTPLFAYLRQSVRTNNATLASSVVPASCGYVHPWPGAFSTKNSL